MLPEHADAYQFKWAEHADTYQFMLAEHADACQFMLVEHASDMYQFQMRLLWRYSGQISIIDMYNIFIITSPISKFPG